MADVVLTVVPFAPAVTGTTVRAGKKVVSVATDAMSAADKMTDVGKVAEGAKATAEVIETVTDAGKAIENVTEVAEIVDDISDTAKVFENTVDAGSKLPVPGPDDFADNLMKSNAKSGDNYLIKNSEEALENAKTNLCKTADNLDAKGVGNVVDGGSSKADTLAQNRIQGKAYEQQEFANFSSQNTNAVEQITIKTESGVRTRVDAIGIDLNGNIVINEFKSSITAPLTNNQKIAFPEIMESGGVVVGKGKGIFTGGYQIPAGTQVKIIRPQ